jgi:S-adenosylmethionine:tRNA ribosyltransferase-isomerase
VATGPQEKRVLRTSDLDYELPESCIATHPVTPRDAARLMVVPRAGGEPADHTVRDLRSLLRPGDLLVFNRTRVLPARFRGRRVGTGGRFEGLYLAERSPGPPLRWHVMLKAGHLRPGVELELDPQQPGAAPIILSLLARTEDSGWEVEVTGAASTAAALDLAGEMPLPPYILAARRRFDPANRDADDRERYQTVFAREPGSVAAPTAGLHFTPELLAALDSVGIGRAEVLLHVGTGTFKPVETEFVESHPMHEEWCSMGEPAAAAIVKARAKGGRVIAVGTTAARTLEAYAAHPGRTEFLLTRLLITPGYQWKSVDGLLTNFHLPRSTLMALVGARLDGDGIARLKAAYRRAMDRGYRFYSYGDAMLVL